MKIADIIIADVPDGEILGSITDSIFIEKIIMKKIVDYSNDCL